MNIIWQARISRANTIYKEWATHFMCETLEKYYEGQQTAIRQYGDQKPYVTNLIYSTIQIQSANIELSYPKFLVTPKPGNSDYNQETAMKSAQIKEDTLNTIIDDEKEAFANTCSLAFLDSKFRFGVIEVGYAADWLRNPLAAPPLLKHQVTKVGVDSSTENQSDDKVKIAQMEDELPDNEKIYFKHIPAARFRVGSKSAQELERCDWVGYYEFVPLADLKAVHGLKSDWLDDIRVYFTEEDIIRKNTVGDSDEKASGGLVKIWHCWDIRAKKRFLILDNPCDVLWEDDFKRLPVKAHRWNLRLKGWYPVPPVFHWLSPQNEYNEARNQMRSHRRRFNRKFQVTEDIEQEEIDKFTSGEDGSLIKVERADAIKAIENPQLDASVAQSLIVSKDDFNEMAGTSAADRGRSDRTTATESQRIGQKADVRDSAEEALWKKFLGQLGREALLIMRDRFVVGTWAKLGADPGEQLLGEIKEEPTYEWVSSEKLDDGYDFKIAVDIISASPLRNEEESKKFLTFLSYVQNFPQIALSPLLIREAAYRAGYRNERVIREMQKMATLTMLGSMQQAQQNAGQGGSGNTAQNVVAQQTPPAQEEILNQLKNQLVQ